VPAPKTGCGEPSWGVIVVNEFGPLVMIGDVADKVKPALPPPHSADSKLSSCPVSSKYVSVTELLANPLPGICVLKVRLATPPML